MGIEAGQLDIELADLPVREVRLSELFPPGKDTLMLYSFMLSEAMPAPCPV